MKYRQGRIFVAAMVIGLGLVHTARAAVDPNLDAEAKAWTSRLTLQEKVGQMIQGEILDIKKEMDAGKSPVRSLNLGSILSGGNSIIAPNTSESWAKELAKFQAEALASSAKIPLLIGVDAVHGHGLVRGTTIFPHNIGLGAARDPELMRNIGAIVAEETLATGFNWTFAPAVTVARDPRWGRTYESFGEHPELQVLLTKPYVEGLQDTQVGKQHLVATAKHFLGDGGTVWGTGKESEQTHKPQIDRGDTRGDLQALLKLHAQGYKEAIAADVDTVMTSYSSINGLKMHEHKELVQNYLKKDEKDGGLGFKGFVISDWNAIDEIAVEGRFEPIETYRKQLVKAVNAGVDMIMVQGKLPFPQGGEDTLFRHERIYQLLLTSFEKGEISEARIDDAVARILRIKLKSGLLKTNDSVSRQTLAAARQAVGESSHREIARKAVRASMVLLKNERAALPITAEKYHRVCVAGPKADDYGIQVGAWTNGWQGSLGNQQKPAGASTLLEGIQKLGEQKHIAVEYASHGAFQSAECRDSQKALVVTVIGEKPYAEFEGDSASLTLAPEDELLLQKTREVKGVSVVLLLSGRPLVLADKLKHWDALVAAWLPGSQGEGVADVLFGDFDFRGKLPITWMKSVDQLPDMHRQQPLYPYGFGLNYGRPQSRML